MLYVYAIILLQCNVINDVAQQWYSESSTQKLLDCFEDFTKLDYSSNNLTVRNEVENQKVKNNPGNQWISQSVSDR